MYILTTQRPRTDLAQISNGHGSIDPLHIICSILVLRHYRSTSLFTHNDWRPVEKNKKSSFGGIYEKITREEYIYIRLIIIFRVKFWLSSLLSLFFVD